LSRYKFPIVILSFTFSLILLAITSGLKIINPMYTDWLQFGDGTGEISWEFFRNQPVIQFPLGKNPMYGLENSSSIVYDNPVPFFSLIFNPLSEFLPYRFQYIGLFLFLTLSLNYFAAYLIFNKFNFTKFQSSISAIIISTTPIIINRFVDHTHYALTSAWIIFFSIYNFVERKNKFLYWTLLYLSCILIHPYYLPFVFVLHLSLLALLLKLKKIGVKRVFFEITIIFTIIFLSAFSIGYFYKNISSEDIGFGEFSSNILSLIDSSGWSFVIPDLPESEGNYEGFAFLGLGVLLLIICSIIILVFLRKKIINQNSFLIIFFPSILLFIYSLSNKIHFGNSQITEFEYPVFFDTFNNIFRSTGRFSWLLVFFIILLTLIYLKQNLKNIFFNTIIIFACVIGIIDIYPKMVSQKNLKFKSKYEMNITRDTWESLAKCYKNIRVYPPIGSVNNYYDFVNLAAKFQMGINTGRFSRLNENVIKNQYGDLHNKFYYSDYELDTLYIFSTSIFINSEIVKFYKDISNFTLQDNYFSSELNGYKFIGYLNTCSKDFKNKNSKNLSFSNNLNERYTGEKLEFGISANSLRYRLFGFGRLENWGVWSGSSDSGLVINTSNSVDVETILITAKSDVDSNRYVYFDILFNDKNVGKCKFVSDFSTCKLKFNNLNLRNNILKINFKTSSVTHFDKIGIKEIIFS